MKIKHYICVAIMALVVACKPHQSETEQVKAQGLNLDKSLENANKLIVQHQHKEIEDYIKNNNWHTTTTGTGLRYEIYKKAEKGNLVASDNHVAIAYTLSLIDGTVCYSVKRDNPTLFRIGHAEQPKGLEEGLCLMKKGEKARFIMPDHLGYGLSGDGKEVPPKATLVYDVELLDVQ